MSFSSWLDKNYPEKSKSSAETYKLIQKAKKNTRFLTITAFVLVYFPTYYIASIISSNLGAELSRGVAGFMVFVLGFVFGSIIFSLVNNHLIKKELSKLVRS